MPSAVCLLVNLLVGARQGSGSDWTTSVSPVKPLVEPASDCSPQNREATTTSNLDDPNTRGTVQSHPCDKSHRSSCMRDVNYFSQPYFPALGAGACGKGVWP